MDKTDNIFESIVNDMITSSGWHYGYVNEAFKSDKLRDFASQHGGLKHGNWSRDFGNDLYNMTDDDFDGYVQTDRDEHYRNYGLNSTERTNPNGYNNNNFKPLEFGDGTFMVKRDPSFGKDDRQKNLDNTKQDRVKRKAFDGAKNYQFQNPYMRQLVNVPYPEYKSPSNTEPRGDWGFKGDSKFNQAGMKNALNPKALKQNHVADTYDYNDWFTKWDDVNNGKYKEDELDKNIVGKAWMSSHGNVNESLGYPAHVRHGYEAPDGNGMTGGHWWSWSDGATADIAEKVFEKAYEKIGGGKTVEDELALEQLSDIDMPISATVENTRDESVGYDGYEITNVTGVDEIKSKINALQIDERYKQAALSAVDEVVGSLETDDLNIDSHEDDYDGGDW